MGVYFLPLKLNRKFILKITRNFHMLTEINLWKTTVFQNKTFSEKSGMVLHFYKSL